METHMLWVGGEARPGRGKLIPIENPATGQIIAQSHAASPGDVTEAIELGHRTFQAGTWSRASRENRAVVLDRAADLVSAPAELEALMLLEVRQTGRAMREMRAQLPTLARWFRYFAAVLRTDECAVLPTTGKLHNFTARRPLGVVALITPFNHPLLIAVKKLAPALAAGNSVVLKPSELAPLTALRLGRVLKAAGLPDGVLAVVPGWGTDTGAALVRNPLVRKVDFTGGTNTGRAIAETAGRNLARFNGELGGKAPVILFPHPDLDPVPAGARAGLEVAVNGIAFGAFVASGQTCVSATRLIVHQSIRGKVVAMLARKAELIERHMGSPEHPDCMMGPLISEKQLARVEELVGEAIGSASGSMALVAGGLRMRGSSNLDSTDFSKGFFYPPTILVSESDDNSAAVSKRLWREEAFGPVVVVVSFVTEEQAVALANDNNLGLGAAVWTPDLSQAFRVSEQIEAGIVWVNTHHRNDPSSPWGGATPESGLGSENGIEAYRAYTTTKSTVINYASVEERAADDWFRDPKEAKGGSAVRYG